MVYLVRMSNEHLITSIRDATTFDITRCQKIVLLPECLNQIVCVHLGLFGYKPDFYFINVMNQLQELTDHVRADFSEMPQDYNNIAYFENGKWGIFFRTVE